MSYLDCIIAQAPNPEAIENRVRAIAETTGAPIADARIMDDVAANAVSNAMQAIARGVKLLDSLEAQNLAVTHAMVMISHTCLVIIKWVMTEPTSLCACPKCMALANEAFSDIGDLTIDDLISVMGDISGMTKQ